MGGDGGGGGRGRGRGGERNVVGTTGAGESGVGLEESGIIVVILKSTTIVVIIIIIIIISEGIGVDRRALDRKREVGVGGGVGETGNVVGIERRKMIYFLRNNIIWVVGVEIT